MAPAAPQRSTLQRVSRFATLPLHWIELIEVVSVPSYRGPVERIMEQETAAKTLRPMLGLSDLIPGGVALAVDAMPRSARHAPVALHLGHPDNIVLAPCYEKCHLLRLCTNLTSVRVYDAIDAAARLDMGTGKETSRTPKFYDEAAQDGYWWLLCVPLSTEWAMGTDDSIAIEYKAHKRGCSLDSWIPSSTQSCFALKNATADWTQTLMDALNALMDHV